MQEYIFENIYLAFACTKTKMKKASGQNSDVRVVLKMKTTDYFSLLLQLLRLLLSPSFRGEPTSACKYLYCPWF